MEKLEVYSSRPKILVIFLVIIPVLAFVNSDLLFYNVTKNEWVLYGFRYFWNVLLIPLSIFLIFDLISSSPKIVINEKGIFDKRLRVGIIEWGDIKAIKPETLSVRKKGLIPTEMKLAYLKLYFQDPMKYQSRRSKFLQKTNGLRFHIQSGFLSTDLSEVYKVIVNNLNMFHKELSQN